MKYNTLKYNKIMRRGGVELSADYSTYYCKGFLSLESEA